MTRPFPASRRVLLIAYHFPPVAGSSGIQRTLKFAAYLRDHGWEALILTISPRAYEQVSVGQMAEIPEGMIVKRAFGLDTARHLAIRGRYLSMMAAPDRWVSWWPAAVVEGWRLIREHRPACIMSTFPIATAHLVGLTLQRLTGLPWLADFRDNMTDPEYPPDPLNWRVNRSLERAAVHRCSKAIFTTPGARQMYEDRYPEVPSSRWAVIENGYDEENFVDAQLGLVPAPLGAPGQLTLIHSGILYPYERDPRPFFHAIRQLKDRGIASARTLQVILRATGNDALYQGLLDDRGISDIVRLAAPVSYRDALREMLCADGLLLFQGAVCNHQIPAKLYEYLRAGRPIFALTDPAGNTADVLRQAEAYDVVDIANAAQIAIGLEHFTHKLRSGAPKEAPRDAICLASRRSRARELALLLDEVANLKAKDAP